MRGAGRSMQKGIKKHAIHGHRSILSQYGSGRVAALTPASEVPKAGVGPAAPGLGNRRSIR